LPSHDGPRLQVIELSADRFALIAQSIITKLANNKDTKQGTVCNRDDKRSSIITQWEQVAVEQLVE
jgi:hypothetical protein